MKTGIVGFFSASLELTKEGIIDILQKESTTQTASRGKFRVSRLKTEMQFFKLMIAPMALFSEVAV